MFFYSWHSNCYYSVNINTMKTIKKIFFIPVVIFSIISFTQCSSAQFEKTAPATLLESSYQEWVGGRPGSKGVLVTLKFTNIKPETVFDSLYFNGKVVKLNSKMEANILTLTGNFVETSGSKDLILDADPKKEFGNKPPSLAQKIPFELNQNEAVINYTRKKKKKYFKLEKLKKLKPLYYQ